MNKINDIKLIIVGDGPLRNYVLSYSRKLKNITYVGKTDTPEIFYNCCDVLLFYTKFEERSRVIPEALGCGMTILSTPTNDLILLKDRYKDIPILFIPYEPSKIAKFILRNVNKLKEIKMGRKQYIIKEQDSRYVRKQIIKVYKNILKI